VTPPGARTELDPAWTGTAANSSDPHARQLRQRPIGIDLGHEIEQSLEIAKRAGGYLDARHARARGRRGLPPPIRSAR
jgi:hypothetical protein